MAKELLNEAERFLLNNWDEARLLEESMETVRAKYKEVFQRIIKEVTEAHPELDTHVVYPTQFWGTGSVGFGRKSWAGDADWPTGFWISNLRLEKLASEESEQPAVTIYISPKSARKFNVDMIATKEHLFAIARELLSPEELEGTGKGDSNDVLLRLPPPSKKELLELLADGDGEKFVARFVKLVDMLARFVPAMDKLFQEHAATKQADSE